MFSSIDQIPRWDLFDFLDRIGKNYNGLMDYIVSSKEYQEWLRAQLDDTVSIGDFSTIANESETPEIMPCEKEFSAIVDKTSSILPGANTILLDHKYHYINIHSSSAGEWCGAIATLDTGSDENWMSQELVDRLELEVYRGVITKWKTFNGDAFSSDATVRATWCSRGKGISYANIFRIVPNAPFDVLFGRNLIMSGDISLSSVSLGAGPVLTTVGPKKKETVSPLPMAGNSMLKVPKKKEIKVRLASEKEAGKKAGIRNKKNGGSHGDVLPTTGSKKKASGSQWQHRSQTEHGLPKEQRQKEGHDRKENCCNIL